MAKVYARNSIFVRAASPIIIQTKPGQSSALAADYENIELSHRLNSVFMSSAVSELTRFPRVASAMNFVSGVRAMSTTNFNVLRNFDYVTGVWAGPDVMDIAQDPRVLSIWEDNQRRILSYPYASPQYTYSVPYSKGQRMYFTSMQEVRRLVGADVANSMGYTGKGINAVVVDTGGHISNPMTTRLVKQTAIPGVMTDENGHGEWCVSALGGTKATDRTFSQLNPSQPPVVNEGIAPGCGITEIKALDLVVGTGTDSWLLKGLDMAISDKADVVSCSWGGTPTTETPQTDPYYAPMQTLQSNNAIVCVASGDSGPDPATCDSPGTLPNVLTVGAVNAVTNTFESQFGQAGEVSGFSSRGPAYGTMIKPDTVSYGAIIDSAISPILAFSYTHVAHEYQAIAGTSQATPIVAGLMVLMKQMYKNAGKTLNLTDVKKMLSQLGHEKNNNDGWGMVTWPMIQTWAASEGIL